MLRRHKERFDSLTEADGFVRGIEFFQSFVGAWEGPALPQIIGEPKATDESGDKFEVEIEFEDNGEEE